MAIDMDGLLRREEFRSLPVEQLESYRNLAERLEGRNVAESMGVLMNFMSNMPKGKTFSKSEQSAMIGAIRESLPPQDVTKFDNIIKMLNLV